MNIPYNFLRFLALTPLFLLLSLGLWTLQAQAASVLISTVLSEQTAAELFKRLPQSAELNTVAFSQNPALQIEIFESRFAAKQFQIRTQLLEKASQALNFIDKKRDVEAEKILGQMEKLVAESRAKGLPGIKGDVLFYVRGFVGNDNNALGQFVLLQEQGGKSEDLENLTNLKRATRLAKALKQVRKQRFASMHLISTADKNEDCFKELEGIRLAKHAVPEAVPGQKLTLGVYCVNGQNNVREFTTFATQQRFDFEIDPRRHLSLFEFPMASALQFKVFKAGFFGIAYPSDIATTNTEFKFEFFRPRQVETLSVQSQPGIEKNILAEEESKPQSEAGGVAFVARASGLLKDKGIYNVGLKNGMWAGGGVYFANSVLGADLLFAQTRVATSAIKPSKRESLSVFFPQFSLHTQACERNLEKLGKARAGLFLRATAGYVFLSKPNFGKDNPSSLKNFTLGGGAGPRIEFSSGLSITLLSTLSVPAFQPRSFGIHGQLRLGTKF